MKSFAKRLAALLACGALAVGMAACGGSDEQFFIIPGNASQSQAASGAYKKIGKTKINGVEYDLVTFGLWPQTIKAANVTVNESKTKTAAAKKPAAKTSKPKTGAAKKPASKSKGKK